MDKDEAIKRVRRIGTSFFGKKRGQLTDEQTLQRMQEMVLATAVVDMADWDATRDALEQVLADCSADELDSIVCDLDGPWAREAGDWKSFWGRVNTSLWEAIETRKRDG